MLNSLEIEKLHRLIEESTRSTEEGVKRFIEPAHTTLSRATSKRHHIVFGRRGSGKSSLLRKAAADLTVDRRPIAYVDLETFKGHSYPDVLISVLIKTLSEFEQWLRTAAVHPANKSSFWDRLFGSKPKRSAFNRKRATQLAEEIKHNIDVLESQLHSEDISQVVVVETSNQGSTIQGGVSANYNTPLITIGSQANESRISGTGLERREEYSRSKLEHLHRNILIYQRLFREMAKLSDGDAFLFLDDLYHIRRSDQANVIDYFHRVAKGNNLWLKIGTIRHRTTWYFHGDPPVGLKMGDDADNIDLDLTLEKYALTKEFLRKLLQGFFAETGLLSVDQVVTADAIDRLVLASGGVARDFLNIFRLSIGIARERLQLDPNHHRGAKIGVEDVNNASGEYEASKREELSRDTLDERTALEDEFVKIREFCLQRSNSNVFLTIKDSEHPKAALIQELVDLRLVHKINSRITVSGRTGKIYEAYMLDTSQYTGSRARRNFEISEFWKNSRDEIRKASLIYLD